LCLFFSTSEFSKLGRPLSDGEVDVGSFVCRDCVRNVRPYAQALRYVDEGEEEEEQRRKRLSELCSAICLTANDTTLHADDRSVFLVPDFASFICKCDRCVAFCTNLFVENDDDEEEEEMEEEEEDQNGLSGAIEGVLATSFDNVCFSICFVLQKHKFCFQGNESASSCSANRIGKRFQQIQGGRFECFDRFLEFFFFFFLILTSNASAKYESGKRVFDEADVEEIKELLKKQKKTE
jgi:hypothetical protein